MKNPNHIHRVAGSLLLAACLTQAAVGTLRAQESQKPKPATVEEFLSDPVAAGANVAEYQGNTYGFFINNKGAIKAIHDSSGKILFDGIGEWVLQRNGTEHAGWIYDKDCEATVTEETEGANKVYNIEIIHPKVLQKTRIVCREIGPDITVGFEIVDFSDGAGVNFPVNLNAANVEAQKPDFKDNPAVFTTKDGGTISVGYNSEAFSPFGTKNNGTYMVGDLGQTFYPAFGKSRDAGAKDTLTLDVQLP